MSAMVLGVATRGWDGAEACVDSWQRTASRIYPTSYVWHTKLPDALQRIYDSTKEPIIAYVHDDVVIEERDWDLRVLKQFDDPDVGLVGFCGGLGHCLPHLYQVPFHIPNMIRRDVLTNMRTAEQHGHRFAGETDVAVLDGFALFVRRSVLDKWGGWPVDSPLGYWLYSEALCCETRRQGMRIRVVGVACDHIGGRTVGIVPLTDDYEIAHRYLYDNNRDVLPYYIGGR